MATKAYLLLASALLLATSAAQAEAVAQPVATSPSSESANLPDLRVWPVKIGIILSGGTVFAGDYRNISGVKTQEP